MTAPPRLSIVLGTFNRLESLKRCIDSIREQTAVATVIHVTDAGSTDGTQDYLASIAGETLKPWLVGRKLGQAKAYNDVFKTLTTPYVAWLSDDNEVVGHGLDQGVHILDHWREIGMVALKVRDVQGPFVAAPYIGGVSQIGVLNVNQGMLRTEVLSKVGYFSEAFGFYGIDPDLTAKVLYAGHDIVYSREVALHHYRDWAMDPDTPEGAALKAHHDKFRRLYQRKYGGFVGEDRRWARKKALWAEIERRLGPRWDHNAPGPWMGGLPRDWYNAFQSRHIHPLDPWLTAGKPFHLRQHVPTHELPSALPDDAAIAD
jgi:GT2 family glycosyltransferase